jgi:pectate lyase
MRPARSITGCLVTLVITVAGCGSSGSEAPNSGGSTAAGGSSSLGTGGRVLSGGSVGTGGANDTGGSTAAGGATTGGSSASGGSLASGGTLATGGSLATGGTLATTGGSSATGGSNTAGSGGKSAAGGNTTAGTVTAGGTSSTGGSTSAKGGSIAGGGTTTGGAAGGGASSGGHTGTTDPNNGADGASKPIGFAAVAGMGLDTTTGGSGGPTVTVSTFEELSTHLDSDATEIILVQGTIDLGGMLPMRSNKTLIGLAGAKLVNGGLEMNKRQNIIVRNITFADGTDDTFKINQNTHHIWVDHCDFTNAADGLFDITRQSSFITISWNKFYTHSKTMLIGHSDSAADDTGYLKTTIHHNWFDGTEQRHPRVRFGEVHVFNNYFFANLLYGVASTMEADVVVEGNYFENVPFPIYSGYQESGPGDVVERNNVYVGSGTPQTRGTAFDPSTAYSYVVENPTGLPPVIKTKAGVGVIDPMAAAR